MQRRTTLYSGITVASMIALVACQDVSPTGLRSGSASFAKGPGSGGTTTPAPVSTTVTGGTGMTAVAAGEVRIDGDPCDVIILAPGNLPLANQRAVYATPGQTVKLYADAGATAGGDFTCHVVLDPAFATGLASGEGLTIQSPDITVDLNGTKLHSDADVLALSNSTLENHGVIVKENKVTVTNSSDAITTIDAFTVNASIAQISDAKLVGRQLAAPTFSPAAAGRYNIQLGYTGGGASLKVDRVIGGTVQSVSAIYTTGVAPLEPRGADVVRSQNILVSDIDVEGQTSGLRFRDTQVARIENSYACGPVLGGVEISRGTSNITVTNVGLCQ